MFKILKRFCTIAGVGTVLVSSVAIGLVPSEAKAVDKGTVSVITCPGNVSGRINLPNKIGSDPAFSPIVDNMYVDASFSSKSQNGQAIFCVYHASGTSGVSWGTFRYSYTAKRPIYNCKSTGTREFTCLVKD